jgi:hypothetical protein
MTHEYYDPSEGIYQHYACAKNGKVLLCNDSDDEYCEASLDLSNQDEVGEAGATAALDDLYANNNEGMKRLADS